MKSYIPYLKYIFLGIFLVASTGVAAYDMLYTKPKKKCDETAKWWSNKDWKCYTPVNITNFTQRPIDTTTDKAAPAAATAAKK